jgi:hypothetical protein
MSAMKSTPRSENDFAYRLTQLEVTELMSQIAISKMPRYWAGYATICELEVTNCDFKKAAIVPSLFRRSLPPFDVQLAYSSSQALRILKPGGRFSRMAKSLVCLGESYSFFETAGRGRESVKSGLAQRSIFIGISREPEGVPKRQSTQITIVPNEIDSLVHVVRGQRVMLDSDLASLYGVTTKRLNEQVGRNRDRFPEDFAYRLTQHEVMALRSQIATSKQGRGGLRYAPWVFTEHGVAMLSSVLRSPTAVRVNIEIMRAFVRLRRLMATPGELVEQLTRLAESVQIHDEQIQSIIQVLKAMQERPEEPRRRIGFHVCEEQ